MGEGRLPQWARDVADTDDLVQDTLLQTFKRIGDFEARGVGALQAYLRQAILNRVRDELRKKGRRPEATELDGLEVDRGLSPLEEAIGRESIERYERALATLRAGRAGGDHRPRRDGLYATRNWPTRWASRARTPRARPRSGRSSGWPADGSPGK